MRLPLLLLPLLMPLAAMAEGATYTSGTGVAYDLAPVADGAEGAVLTSRTPETYHPGHMAPDGPAVSGIETLRLLPDCSVESALLGPGSWISLGPSFVISLVEGDTISFDQPPPVEAGSGC